MRGKGHNRKAEKGGLRITPAYAGKRAEYFTPEHVTEDHPRLCGEKWYNNRRGELYAGSPPPMRGKDALKIDSDGF